MPSLLTRFSGCEAGRERLLGRLDRSYAGSVGASVSCVVLPDCGPFWDGRKHWRTAELEAKAAGDWPQVFRPDTWEALAVDDTPPLIVSSPAEAMCL